MQQEQMFAHVSNEIDKALGIKPFFREQVVDHDCHASPQDGCESCQRIANELLLDHVSMDQDCTERAIKEHEDGLFGEVEE